MKQQIDLRILVLDTNKLDFVNNASDYRTIMSVIDKDYSIGIHRVTF
jgi:hypothetical protein